MNVTDYAELQRGLLKDIAANFKPPVPFYEVARGPLLATTDEGVRTITISMPAAMGKTRLL